MTGNWKTNVGQSILEEVAVQDKYRNWIDQVGGKKDPWRLQEGCLIDRVVGDCRDCSQTTKCTW